MSIRFNTSLLVAICISFYLGDRSNAGTGFSYEERNKFDLKFATHLDDIRVQLRRGKLKRKTLNGALVSAKKSKMFRGYVPLVRQIRSLDIVKNLGINKLVSSCLKVGGIKEKVNEPVFNSILRFANEYCISKYLSSKLKIRKPIRTLSVSEKKLLRREVNRLLSKRGREKFIKFLKRVAKNSKAHTYVGGIVTSYYIDLNKMPNSRIISHLAVDEYLTTYIQLKGLEDKQTKRFFKLEFLSMKRRLEKKIRENDYKSVQRLVDHIVGFYGANRGYIDSKYALDIFKVLTKRLIFHRRYSTAVSLAKVNMELATPELKDEAMFIYIWALIRKGSYNLAVKTVERNHILENFEKISSKLRYWSAMAIKYSGQLERALGYLHRQIEISPINYYSVLSFKQIQKVHSDIDPNKLFNKYRDNSRYALSAKEYISLVSRLDVWMSSGSNRFVDLELGTALKDSTPIHNDRHIASDGESSSDGSITLKLVEYLNKNNSFLRAFRVLYHSIENKRLGVNKEILRSLFPFQYIDTIKKIDSSVDPLVILSLMRQESAFDPRAISVVGARGLMQLMPSTAIRFRRGLKKSHLKIPNINISIGIKYFRLLLKKYRGNLIYALSAYNAGENNVKKWKRRYWSGSNSEEIIEEIPFRETRKYVKLIYRNIFFYNMLSGNKKFLNKKAGKTYFTNKY